jgi:hypothetical protein
MQVFYDQILAKKIQLNEKKFNFTLPRNSIFLAEKLQSLHTKVPTRALSE